MQTKGENKNHEDQEKSHSNRKRGRVNGPATHRESPQGRLDQ